MPSNGRADCETPEKKWDAFISHASEDKEAFVEPLAEELRKYGLEVWFDKFSLRVGSSLRESIDEGLSESRFGIVVLSHIFFTKGWPQKELNGLFAIQAAGRNIILPVWHGVTKEDVLRYTPLMTDLVAANSAVGVPAVARQLVGVIRPEALRIETSVQDTTRTATRLREQLKTQNPSLDSRVSYGLQETDPAKISRTFSERGLIASSAIDGMKIELFAKDREAYNRNPLSFKCRMPIETWNKLEEVTLKGRQVEFGPESGVELSDEFFAPFGMSAAMFSGGLKKLIVTPSPEVMQRKYRFKLTFALAEVREEYQYPEFEMVRPGEEELEIRSHAPPMPFRITFNLSLTGKANDMHIEFSYEGYEIREIYKINHALRLFWSGGSLELINLDTNYRFPLLTGAKRTSVEGESDLYQDSLMELLHEIAIALNEQITWKLPIEQDDIDHLLLIQKVIRTGKVFSRADNLTWRGPLNEEASAKWLSLQGSIWFRGVDAPNFATAVGKKFELGPYFVEARIQKIELLDPEGDSAERTFRITPDGDLVYVFVNFLGESARSRNFGGAATNTRASGPS